MENSLKKKIINQIYLFNHSSNIYKKNFRVKANIYDVRKGEKLKRIFNLFNKKRYDFLMFDMKKIERSFILEIFCNLFMNSVLFNRNICIFYNLNSEIRGENFFPVWPGSYKKMSFLKSLYIWMKKLLSVLIYFKKIEFILIRI